MTNLFDILDAYLGNVDNNDLNDLENIIAYAEHGMGIDITIAQAQRISDVGKRWLAEQESGNGEWSRMRHDAKEALTFEIHDLEGHVARFAEACFDQNSIDELRAALAGNADATDCKTWDITGHEWQLAINAALNALSDQGQ